MSRLGTGLPDTGVVPWACPIPCFGDPAAATVATLGLNPSDREFADGAGNELDGAARRFPTLNSLKLTSWSEAGPEHLALIEHGCRTYFSNNPFNNYFKRLDYLLGGVNASFYDDCRAERACHLDLAPYATTPRWGELSSLRRSNLLRTSSNTLGVVLRDSRVRLLVLNGNGVVREFGEIPGVTLRNIPMPGCDLPRAAGMAYEVELSRLFDIDLNRSILVIGFNHNIPGSRGVTRSIKDSIREWIGIRARANPAP